MTSPVRVQSTITTKIINHFSMTAEDTRQLYEQLLRQLTVTYRQVIQQQLVLYGCQKTVTGLDSVSLAFLEAKAQADAEVITKTYQRELGNKVRALYAENRRGNRFFYMRNLDAWLALRTPNKTAQISLNTMTQAREYAQTRFVQENNIKGRWVLTGPPPVCKICLRIKALGAVTFEVTQKRRLPSHPNCPHKWSQLVPTKISCENAWTG